MQCNSTNFTTGTLLNFLGFIKNYAACRPAACKKFQQSQLGYVQKTGPSIEKTDDKLDGSAKRRFWNFSMIRQKIVHKNVKNNGKSLGNDFLMFH